MVNNKISKITTMKKITFFVGLLLVGFVMFSQKQVKFKLGSTEVTEVDCADDPDLSQLKVVIPALPAEAANYDKVLVKMALYHWANGDLSNTYAYFEIVGKNDIKKFVNSKKDIELTLFKPNSNFDFYMETRPSESKYDMFPLSIKSVCEFTRTNLLLKETSVIIQVGFYNITRTEYKYDDRTGTWHDFYYYGLKKIYAKGQLPIKLKPVDQSWTDNQQRIKIQFIEPEKYRNNAWNDDVHTEIIQFSINTNPDADFGFPGIEFRIQYEDIKNIEAEELFQKTRKKLSRKGIDYTPLQFVIDVIENKAGAESSSNYKYSKPRWVKLPIVSFSDEIPEYQDLRIHNALSTGSKPDNPRKLFKEEKLGNNTYYIYDVPASKGRQRHFIILTQTDNYIYRLDCEERDSHNEFTDEDATIMRKALAGMEFLK